MDLSEIELLSDEELFSKLQTAGLVCGPIADSTRALYQNILYKGLLGEPIFGEDSPRKNQDTEDPLINSTGPPAVTPDHSRRSVSLTPLDREATPLGPVLRSQRKTPTIDDEDLQEELENRGDRNEVATSTVQRRHTFKRWNPAEDDPVYAHEEEQYSYESFEPRHAYNSLYKTPERMQNRTGNWVFVVIGVVVIVALAALYFVGSDTDQFQVIEKEAVKVAVKGEED